MPQAEQKPIAYTLSRRLMRAKLLEYSLVEKFAHGYRNREDITTLPPGVLVPGSLNVLTNTYQRVGPRKGFVLDGQRDTSNSPIGSSFDWARHTGDVRNLRAGNGKLQFRYKANAGDIWNGNTFTQDQVYWIDLMTGIASTNYNFCDFWDFNNEVKDLLLFVNGQSEINMWSGALATLESASNASGLVAGISNPPYAGGSGYHVNDILTLANGGMSTVAYAPTNGGNGYHTGDILTVGGGLGTVIVDSVNVNVVTGVLLRSSGSGYSVASGVATTGGAGNGCTINITAITGGTGATVAVGSVDGSGAVTGAILETPGTGYTGVTGLGVTGGHGTGALITITGTAVGYIQINGTESASQLGFLDRSVYSQKVLINNNVYTYNGSVGTYLIGVSPLASAEPVQSIIIQGVVTTPNSGINGIPSTLKNSLINNLKNQIYLCGQNNQNVYVSKINNFTDFTFSMPRVVGQGAVLTLDGVPTDLIPQQSSMYISAGTDFWYITSFTLDSTLANETLNINRLKTSALQGAISQAATTKIKNNICFLSFEPIINTLGTTANYYNDPQVTDISFPIVNDMNSYNFTGASLFFFRKYLYVAVPAENLVLIYNMTEEKNPYWEAPQVMPISRFAIIEGELYGHSSQTSNTFKLFTGTNDDGHFMNANVVLSYNNLGTRTLRKNSNGIFVEGYITTNSVITVGLQRELNGNFVSFKIKGTDTQIVNQPTDIASLGKSSLGKNPLGGSTGTITTPKFRVIKTFPRSPYFEEQISIESTGVDQQWEIIAVGTNAETASELPTNIQQ
jgi:hypothetical protein